MKYSFKCKKCGKEIEKEFSMGKVGIVMCPKCNRPMHQQYKASVNIPEYMMAGSEEADTTDWVKNRMNTRPSGKDKIYY